ncbi:MAG: pitrilysin family protein [Bryobacteraceae bacterium]
MTRILAMMLLASSALAQIRMVALPGKSPLVTFRIVFLTGAASDPEDKPGLANLTAAMIAQGGTKDLTYKQIVDAMFPMATSVSSQVDKEMTVFSGTTHVDNLDAYYNLFRSMLLEPGWREDDFKRLKDDAVNYLRVGLRGNNDEELGKEALYGAIYEGTPYGHETVGTISALQKMTLDDVKQFYHDHYTQRAVIAGIAGGYPAKFVAQVTKDFEKLPNVRSFQAHPTHPKPIAHNRLTIVDKNTRSVAYSLGYPIAITRRNAGFPALLVAQAYFGQHRVSIGRLYQRMRELRGLNYGDYAYIEYFPRGMFLMEPNPNLGRQQQIFQMWIRPVEPATAKFALRLALFELNRLVKTGLSEEEFERSRDFVSKYVTLLTKTKNAELGYAIDSVYYGIPNYVPYIRSALAKMTREQVNQAIRSYLRPDKLQIVAVTRDGDAFKQQLLDAGPSPMTYNSAKPQDILDEDKVVENWNLNLRPEDIQVVPVDKVFE